MNVCVVVTVVTLWCLFSVMGFSALWANSITVVIVMLLNEDLNFPYATLQKKE
jgi:hypothetical protein